MTDNANNTEPPSKRLKANEDENVLKVISSHVMKGEESLYKSYETATPFSHGRIEGIFVDGFLEKVLDEVKINSKVKFKESDLFRVYQSIDLGNLSEDSPEAKKMPSLMAMRAAIYSPEYRSFVERINHLEPGVLTEQVDCAANCHAPGCHLLCHDDVIGTRKVSYIIYLTDPEPDWTKSEGGCLELYSSVEEEIPDSGGRKRLVPEPAPSKTVLPTYNSMAYFVVEPGVSFHSVQEVFGERPRLSIQGWYHAKDVPQQIEDATLNRLKSTAKGEDTEGSFVPLTSKSESFDTNKKNTFSQEDRDFLGKYINEIYLNEKSMKEICEQFEEVSSVQLRHFFKDEWAKKIGVATSREDKLCKVGRRQPVLDYNIGVSKEWKSVGPAHKQRFLEYVGDDTIENTGTENNGAGSLLIHLKQNVLQSAAFGRFIEELTSLGFPLGHRGRVRRFRPGLDYTVAHYGILTTQPVLDATLCFAAGNGEQCRYDDATGELIGDDDDAVWESGDYGGFECYIAADDEEENEEEAADEYNEEDDTELLSVSASNNTLSLVFRDPGTMRFVKYVGSGAPSSRWDISMEYEIEETGEDEGEA